MMSDGHPCSIFYELKTLCLDLLDFLQNRRTNPSATVSQLYQFLRRSPPHALHPFLDYTLFPLLLILDAAINCRSQKKDDGMLKVSDSVVEGTLQCLEELLGKCCIRSVNQLVQVMKKLSYGASLSPSEASEEFRDGIIRCFKAMLLSLCKTCSCKQTNGWPALLPTLAISKYDDSGPEPEECLLLFLRSQAAAPAVGHWLSLLLKTADVEASRGHRGSAKTRAEAFTTLRVLVAKVGTADALAFFLPGVVSQLGKALIVSKTMISGAAGSVETIDQAIRGLAEFLMIVLEDDANQSGLEVCIDGDDTDEKSPLSFLEELRKIPLKLQSQSGRGSTSEETHTSTSKPDSKVTMESLHVNRTKDWVVSTSAHVDKLLSATFPHLCIHPAKKVRRGILAAVKGLLLKCSSTMKISRLMLLECLFVLVCDDFEEISGDAQLFIEYLFASRARQHIQDSIAEIFCRLVENLPKVVLSGDESLAVSHAQKLLVVVYYSGPQLVKEQILQSPVTAARFLDAFALCLNQNSQFSGSLQKHIIARPSSTGYLHSIAEMKAINVFSNDPPKVSSVYNKILPCSSENVQKEYELPHMPPWFTFVGSQKLYQSLAGVLRLVGLSLFTDSPSVGSLSVIIDILLGYLRKLVSDVRAKQHRKESWRSWYQRSNSSESVRQASTAACILNEIIFGLSDRAVNSFANMFHNSSLIMSRRSNVANIPVPDESPGWNFGKKGGTQLIDCIRSVLHEYLSPEIWDLPLESADINMHFVHDNAMLHQVLIDGIGIFNLCLGQEFASCGFLHLSLYVLLENLICSNFQIRNAVDAVLHVISATSGHPTVGHLVLANSDYVIDSICRQLRHLDLNPHVPSVLASMLSYIGVAHKILPMLEEPMRSVSLELEILGRHQHPDLTIPFLKALAEITKASKHEACLLPTQAESYCNHVKSKVPPGEKPVKGSGSSMPNSDSEISMECSDYALETEVDSYTDADKIVKQWELILMKLNDSRRYRRTVGCIAGSCTMAATPLLASLNRAVCLVALDIVEDGILGLAKVEEAHRHEKECKEVIREALESNSWLYNLVQDTVDVDESDENRLLPAMNKIWPFLVACLRNKNPVAVRRCSRLISSAIQICGGDFFSRRFHTDGPHLWKLLATSPFEKKKQQRSPLLLPYRKSSSIEETSEISDMKVQAELLNMIADLASNKKSASALVSVFKKVVGIVVGIACSGVVGLRDASVNALLALSSIDSDFVWLLLADLYYSNPVHIPPAAVTTTGFLPGIPDILPPPLSPKDYLYVQYGGQTYGFGIDFSCVQVIFDRLQNRK